MKLSKREIKKIIKSRCYDISFSFNNNYGNIIPDCKTGGYNLAFENQKGDISVLDVSTVNEVMTSSFFAGKRLKDIYKSVDFTY